MPRREIPIPRRGFFAIDQESPPRRLRPSQFVPASDSDEVILDLRYNGTNQNTHASQTLADWTRVSPAGGDGDNWGRDGTYFIENTYAARLALDAAGDGTVCGIMKFQSHRYTACSCEDSTSTVIVVGTGDPEADGVPPNTGVFWPLDPTHTEHTLLEVSTCDSVSITLASPLYSFGSGKVVDVYKPLATLDDWDVNVSVLYRPDPTQYAGDYSVPLTVFLVRGQCYSPGSGDTDNRVVLNLANMHYDYPSLADPGAHKGWRWYTANALHDGTFSASNVSTTDTSIPITGVYMQNQRASTAVPIRGHVARIRITKPRRLATQAWDGSTLTTARKGAAVLMLDDCITPYAKRLADEAFQRGIPIVYPVWVNELFNRNPGGTLYTETPETVARMSEMGHEFIMHDYFQSYQTLNEDQAYDRISRLLEDWVENAPKYGIRNWESGMRFWVAPGNVTPSWLYAIYDKLFTAAFGDFTYTQDGDGSFRDNVLPKTWYNIGRRNFSAKVYGEGATQSQHESSMGRANSAGSIMVIYGHECSDSDGSGSYAQETLTNWRSLLDYAVSNSVRVVTCSKLFDDIIPREALRI